MLTVEEATMMIFASDIGGTNSRFGVFEADEKGRLSKLFSQKLRTRDYDSFASLMEAFVFSLPALYLRQRLAAVVAVAGPVENGSFSMPPNIPWSIDTASLPELGPLQRPILINDFAAQAYACLTPVMEKAERIRDGKLHERGTKAVIGAGTGLGQAVLIHLPNGGFTVLSSEGSHAPFPFSGEEEFSYCRFLMSHLNVSYVEYDTVVSGKSISMLHLFLTGSYLQPWEITSKPEENAVTIDWFARFYARACRAYALHTLCIGGLYVTGGVAAKAPFIVRSPVFLKEFCDSKCMAHILSNLPLFLNRDEESGLWGAAFAASKMC